MQLKRLIKSLVFAALILGVAGFSFGPDKIAHPPFWIAKKGTKTIYLLGTIHVKVYADEIPDQVWDDLTGTNQVFVERDTTYPSHYDAPMAAPYGLRKKLTSSEFRFLVEDLSERAGGQVDETWVDSLTPMVADALLQRDKDDQDDMTQNRLLDQQVVKKANYSDIHVQELDVETTTSYSAMMSLSDFQKDLERRMALGHSKSQAQDKAAVMATADNYRKGICVVPNAKDQSVEIDPRNLAWFQTIENYVSLPDTKSIFIGVGCAHVWPGATDALTNLLTKDGWTVQRY